MPLETLVANYKLLKKVKDAKFDVDDLHHYGLCLQVGIRDFQFCVIDNRDNRCLLYEDFAFENVKTVNARLQVVQDLFENHHLLMAGFWSTIKLSVKSHKFALVPQPVFSKEGLVDYLSFNTPFNPRYEEVYFYKHNCTPAVYVFSADKKLIDWVRELYNQKEVIVVHQGSAFIEGILKYNDHSGEKSMFCLVDKGILHVVITSDKKLHYYNQFAVRKSADYLKYIMLVFKEMKLSQKKSKVLFWGGLTPQSPHIQELKKYIRDISFGSRPSYLSFSFVFDEIPDHKGFDVFNIFLCD
ncbi:MAG: DUF3822 family protein [Imperialibacter sp.]